MKTIHKSMTQLIEQTDHQIYLDLLNKDISARRLPLDIKKEVIDKSIRTAELFVAELLNTYGEMQVSRYALKLEVPIMLEKTSESNYYNYLGLFREKDHSIVVNMSTISVISKIVKNLALEEIIDIGKIKDVVVAHELFHYFEFKHPEAYTNQRVIDAKVLGLFKTKSKLLAASEIAAIHFSKIITGLKHTPIVYDRVYALGKKLN